MKLTSLTLGSAFIASATLALSAHAGETFSSTSLSQGYQVASADGKAKDAACGAGSKSSEAKCGASKAHDGKCGAGKKSKEAKCGASKAHDGKCGAGKAGHAKCGASKPAPKASS